eukprot:IDg3252t1
MRIPEAIGGRSASGLDSPFHRLKRGSECMRESAIAHSNRTTSTFGKLLVRTCYGRMYRLACVYFKTLNTIAGASDVHTAVAAGAITLTLARKLQQKRQKARKRCSLVLKLVPGARPWISAPRA